jgi:hypothetical protein
MPRTLSRRTALKTLGGGAGAVVLLPWLSEEGVAAFNQVQKAKTLPALRVLSPAQYTTVDLLVEAIIPGDENSPGAREARVADYVDLLLSEAEPAVKQEWLEGLAALDAEAKERFGAPFARVDPTQADELLAEMSRGERAAKPTALEAFFITTKQAAIRGYYTSEIGIHKELRYKGNQILAEFTGCHTQDGKDCPLCGQKAEG